MRRFLTAALLLAVAACSSAPAVSPGVECLVVDATDRDVPAWTDTPGGPHRHGLAAVPVGTRVRWVAGDRPVGGQRLDAVRVLEGPLEGATAYLPRANLQPLPARGG